MRRTKRFLTMALAGVMMMGAVVAFTPAPKADANEFCHGGAADTYVGTFTKDCPHCGFHGDCQGRKCAACNQITYFCGNSSCKKYFK